MTQRWVKGVFVDLVSSAAKVRVATWNNSICSLSVFVYMLSGLLVVLFVSSVSSDLLGFSISVSLVLCVVIFLAVMPCAQKCFLPPPPCSVSTSSSVCTIAPLGTLSSHRTFSLYVHSPANISRCLSLFSFFLFWSSQSTFQEARLRDPKHYIGDEDSDNFFFFWLLLARRE